jgi:hypothetical protein
MENGPAKPHHPKPLRVLSVSVAAADWQPPKAFSYDQLSFDAEPADRHLCSLLGSSDWIDVVLIECNGVLIAKPRLVPMQFVIPWMIFIACVITAAPWYVPKLGGEVDSVLWLMIALMWVFILPAMFALLHTINRYFADQGDYLRADRVHRTLQLPRLGITLEDRDIVYFTEVLRSFWIHGKRDRQRAVGVVVQRNGEFDFYPILREEPVRFKKQRLAEVLAGIYRKDLRRIELSYRQSKALSDQA